MEGEGQAALKPEPRAQLASLLLNYSSQGRGIKSRNRNNKAIISNTNSLQFAIGAISGRALSLLPEQSY